MPNTSDPNIPLQAGQNIPTFGFMNPQQRINMQVLAIKLQQAQQNQNAQNMLRSLYGNQENFDPTTNQLKPAALNMLTAAYPQEGMAVRSDMLKNQEEQARASYINSNVYKSYKSDLINDVTIPSLKVYDDALASGKPPPEAQQMAQKNYTDSLNDWKSSSGAPPSFVQSLAPNFDPVRARNNNLVFKQQQAAAKTQLENSQKEQQLSTEAQRASTEQQKADQAQKNAEKGQWAVLTDPGKKDANGNPVQFRYNATQAKATTLEGKPYVPTGAAKIGAASTGAPASPSEVEYWANVLRNGGALPGGLARTKEGSDMVRQIMAKVPGSGTDPGAFIANHATAKANTTSLSNMTKMTDAATSFEQTANKNFDLALKLSKGAIPTNWGPLLNHWVESGETQFGNEKVPEYVTALMTAANEYAKIMSGSTGSQGSTVDSRREASQLFSPYLNAGQIDRVVAVAKTDMDNRKASLYGQVEEIKDRLKGGGTSAGNSAPIPPKEGAPANPNEIKLPAPVKMGNHPTVYPGVTYEMYQKLKPGDIYTVPGNSTPQMKQ